MRGISKKVTKKELMDALEKSGGIIQDALAICGMSHTMFFAKYRHDPDVEALLNNLHKLGFDLVSQTLYQLAIAGNVKAIGLYIKYCPEFKAQGWVDEQRLTIKEDKPLTDEEKFKLAEDLFGKA